MSIQSLSISKLKTDMPHVMAKVLGGDQVLVTRRGRPVAMLCPVPLEHRPPENETSPFEEAVTPKWLRDLHL